MDSDTDATSHTLDPYLHRQLFLDDHAIGESSGVRRVLHQPERLGAILKPDVSRGQMALQSKSPPWWNPDLRVWEWWYWAMYDEIPGQMYASEGRVSHYATSTDGVNWDTTSLGMHEFRGSKDNNVAYDTSERGLALYHIIRDDSDPDPDRRFKGIFATADRLADRLPGFSPDGFDWTFPEAEPTPSKDTSNYLHDRERRVFVGMVKHGTEWGRSVWLVTSEDFVTWTDPRLVLHSDLEDRRNRKARVEAVVRDPAYLSPPLVDGVDYLAEVYQMAFDGLRGDVRRLSHDLQPRGRHSAPARQLHRPQPDGAGRLPRPAPLGARGRPGAVPRCPAVGRRQLRERPARAVRPAGPTRGTSCGSTTAPPGFRGPARAVHGCDRRALPAARRALPRQAAARRLSYRSTPTTAAP